MFSVSPMQWVMSAYDSLTSSAVDEGFYLNNGLKLVVKSGDITSVPAGAIVVGEDEDFSGKGIVARTLLQKGGEQYEKAKSLLRDFVQADGCSSPVYCCPAGKSLKFDHVLHAITTHRGLRPANWTQHLQSLFYNVGRMAESHHVTSVATPLLGAGNAGGSVDISLGAFVNGFSMLAPKVFREVILVEFDLKKAVTIRETLRQLLLGRLQQYAISSKINIQQNLPGRYFVLSDAAHSKWMEDGSILSSSLRPADDRMQHSQDSNRNPKNFESNDPPAVHRHDSSSRTHGASSTNCNGVPASHPPLAAGECARNNGRLGSVGVPNTQTTPHVHGGDSPYLPSDSSSHDYLEDEDVIAGMYAQTRGSGDDRMHRGNRRCNIDDYDYERGNYQSQGHGKDDYHRKNGTYADSASTRHCDNDSAEDHLRFHTRVEWRDTGRARWGPEGNDGYGGRGRGGGQRGILTRNVRRGRSTRGQDVIQGRYWEDQDKARDNTRRAGYPRGPRRPGGSKHRQKATPTGDTPPKVGIRIVYDVGSEGSDDEDDEDDEDVEEEETIQQDEELKPDLAETTPAGDRPSEDVPSQEDATSPRSSSRTRTTHPSLPEEEVNFNSDKWIKDPDPDNDLPQEEFSPQSGDVITWSSCTLPEHDSEFTQSSTSTYNPSYLEDEGDLEHSQEEGGQSGSLEDTEDQALILTWTPHDNGVTSSVEVEDPILHRGNPVSFEPTPESEWHASDQFQEDAMDIRGEVLRESATPDVYYAAGTSSPSSPVGGGIVEQERAVGPLEEEWRKPENYSRGNMPSGKMIHSTKEKLKLDGFTDCGTILIEYSFPNGIQESDHPAPGEPYKGTFRRAFLPDNPEGQRVCSLLQKAFDRKLTFEIVQRGASQEWVVDFAAIPHKTSLRGGPESNGYPDDEYLHIVLNVLEHYGIRE